MTRTPSTRTPSLAALALLAVLVAAGGSLRAGAAGGSLRAGAAAPAAEPPPARHPTAVAAERAFFAAFNHGGDGEAPLAPLMMAWAADPADGRTNLLLGLDHLWLAAEGDRTDVRLIDHLLLAEVFLARAERLAPGDGRIASWLTPTRLALAGVTRDAEAAAAARRALEEAYRLDPAFHSFSIALLGFDEPRGSEPFERGLAALRRVEAEGCAPEDPSCENRRRWPHNVEGFLAFDVDYRLKAGDRAEAARLVAELRAQPDYPAWPLREEAERRFADLDGRAALFANDDPGDDPQPLIVTHGCASCHLAGEAAEAAATNSGS